ncbi:MAG: hypothetical protein ABSH50_23900, partial [Bryobacteraceae bacterium]
GAGKARLIGQLLAESILLSAVSGAVALISVALMKTALLKLAPSDLPRVNEVALSPGVLLFAFFVSILTGVIFGLVPALQTVRPNQAGNLREGSRGSGSSKHQIRILRILVSSEIALSLVLCAFWFPQKSLSPSCFLSVPGCSCEVSGICSRCVRGSNRTGL